MSRVYILLVNWNGWSDTIECLESVCRLDYPDFRVVVCDNGSTDDSLARITSWADGRQPAPSEAPPTVRQLTVPPVPKPLSWVELGHADAERGGDLLADPQLTLIRIGKNLGFAGGNNVGLRYALARGDADFCWLLNNDTVVSRQALSALVDRLEAKPRAGLCGSTVLNYREPHLVDALGGAYYCRWLGLAWHRGRWRRVPQRIVAEKVEEAIDYVVGSSLLVSRSFLMEVGLMEEAYFLYYEELDWARRAEGRFDLAYAPESLVYHKTGRSIGTTSNPGTKSLTSDYYTVRNRVAFTRKHHPWALPTVYLGLLCALGVRLLLGEWRKAKVVWEVLTGRLPQPPGVCGR